MWPKFALLFVLRLVLVCSTQTSQWFSAGRRARSERSYNILGIFPQVYRSHSFIYNPIMEALAERGHNVTTYSYFQLERTPPLPNFHQIDVKSCFPKSRLYMSMEQMRCPSTFQSLDLIFAEMAAYWNTTTACRPLAELLRSGQQFDLLVTQPFNSDLFSAFAHHLNISTSVYVFTSSLFTWLFNRMGSPSNPSHVPVRSSAYLPSGGSSFAERLENVYRYVVSELYYAVYFRPESERVYRAVFGERGPPLERIAANTSLILSNTHFSLHSAVPLVPGIVEVAGVNIREASKLPDEIQKFIDDANHGVIYFCMGSLLPGETFPVEKRNAFVEAFAEIPQRVLWKWEADVLPGKSDNVMTSKWMPQRDILAHPNVKLFIAHGGLLGTTEAVYEGKPILGIPIFGDQKTNLKVIEVNGAGEVLDYEAISKAEILKSIRGILNNPKYEENARHLSARFKDRPLPPLDTAVYWTEYVIRHKGAAHLRTAAVDMPWHQYLLFDVIGLLAVCLIFTLLFLYCACKIIWKFVRKLILRRQEKPLHSENMAKKSE